MIEIGCSADAPYLPHVSVMLHSVLSHTPTRPLRVWLTHDTELPEEGRQRLEAVVEGQGATIEYVTVPPALMSGFSTKKFHAACWHRILLPDLLPQVDRILYLDCDIIVTDDLTPLWETPLADKLFGAVCNPLFPLMRNWPRQDLGLDDPLDYLNSGVLLLDLRALRGYHLGDQLRDYSLRHPDRLLPEQDALSDLMRGRWLKLHPRWNLQTTFYDLPAWLLPFPKPVVREALERPAVIHYNGPFKPWQYLCKHPLRSLYFDHLQQTPWPRQPLERSSLPYRLIKPLPVTLQYRVFELRKLWRRLRGLFGRWASVFRPASP